MNWYGKIIQEYNKGEKTMNYIMLNSQKIELTDTQVEEMKKSLGITSVLLSDIPVAELFKIGKHEFFVLEQRGEETVIILKSLLRESEKFGDNNNYDGSNVDKICNDFAKEIANIVGKENIVEHTVDLTSDDGLDDYGKIKRKMSLLTCELYRKYVRILDKFKLDKWWWLATAFSTPTHDDEDWIKCVSPRGVIFNFNHDNYFGVRPFCILKSNIFVSK